MAERAAQRAIKALESENMEIREKNMNKENLDTIERFFAKYYPHLSKESKKVYTQTLKKYIATGEKPSYFLSSSFFQNYEKFINSVEEELSREDYLNYVCPFVDTLENISVKTKELYCTALRKYIKEGTFGSYSISNRFWNKFTDYVKNNFLNIKSIEPNVTDMIQEVLDKYEVKKGAVTKGRELWNYLCEISGDQVKAKLLKDELFSRFNVKKRRSLYYNIQRKNSIVEQVKSDIVKKEVEPEAKFITSEIQLISKEDFDKKAKLFLDSYKVMNRSLYKEIKEDILNFIKKYLYGNYEKDCIRLDRLTSQQKEIYEQYKTVIQDFMNTYKPVQNISQVEKDFTVKVHSIQTQIKSLTSVIDSLKNELVRLSTELEAISH